MYGHSISTHLWLSNLLSQVKRFFRARVLDRVNTEIKTCFGKRNN